MRRIEYSDKWIEFQQLASSIRYLLHDMFNVKLILCSNIVFELRPPSGPYRLVPTQSLFYGVLFFSSPNFPFSRPSQMRQFFAKLVQSV